MAFDLFRYGKATVNRRDWMHPVSTYHMLPSPRSNASHTTTSTRLSTLLHPGTVHQGVCPIPMLWRLPHSSMRMFSFSCSGTLSSISRRLLFSSSSSCQMDKSNPPAATLRQHQRELYRPHNRRYASADQQVLHPA